MPAPKRGPPRPNCKQLLTSELRSLAKIDNDPKPYPLPFEEEGYGLVVVEYNSSDGQTYAWPHDFTKRDPVLENVPRLYFVVPTAKLKDFTSE